MDIFELTDTEAANALDIKPSAYRQRLRRARANVIAFVQSSCGLVSSQGKCRCENRVSAVLSCGRVHKGRSALTGDGKKLPPLEKIQQHIATLEKNRADVALMRSNPDFSSNIGALVLQRLDRSVPPTMKA